MNEDKIKKGDLLLGVVGASLFWGTSILGYYYFNHRPTSPPEGRPLVFAVEKEGDSGRVEKVWVEQKKYWDAEVPPEEALAYLPVGKIEHFRQEAKGLFSFQIKGLCPKKYLAFFYRNGDRVGFSIVEDSRSGVSIMQGEGK